MAFKIALNTTTILMGLLAVLITLRFVQLGTIPLSLYWDEAAMLADARILAETGRDMHNRPWNQVLFLSYGDYKLPVYIWMAAISVKLLGVSEFALRLPSALAGIGTIIIAALIAKRIQLFDAQNHKNKLFPYATALAIAMSPWAFTFGRTAFEGHLGQFLLALSAYVLLSQKNIVFRVLVGTLFGALATYTYFSVRFVWPVVFILILAATAWKELESDSSKKRTTILKYALSAFVGVLFFMSLLIPMFRSPVYADSNRFRLGTNSVLNAYDYPLVSNKLREQAGNTILDRVIFHRHLLMLQELARNYADGISLDFLFLHGDSNLRHGTGEHGLFLLPFLIPFVIGLVQALKNNRKAAVILIGWWIISLLPASVPEETPHALRSLNALVPISLLIGMGLAPILEVAFQSLSQLHKKSREAVLYQFGSLAFLCIAGLASASYLTHYFLVYPVDSALYWQDGYTPLTRELISLRSSVDSIYAPAPDDRFFLWLIAYGDFSAEEIQSTPTTDYKFKSLGNVHFQPFDWQKLSQPNQKILVTGIAPDLSDQAVEAEVKPKWIKTIYGAQNQPLYELAYYET